MRRYVLFALIGLLSLGSVESFTSLNRDTASSRNHQNQQESSELGAVEISTNDAAAEDWKTEQRHLRFAGVGRLFTSSDSATSTDDAAANEDNLERHLQIVEKLTSATVVVVGLGGVGSWAAEALCRSGIGHLVMIDLDDVCISNTNRQLHAMSPTVGKMKIDVLEQRFLDINPECNVTLIHDFVSRDNIDEILATIPDATACLDAIDGASSKSALIASCARSGIPLVTVGGSAGRLDPTKIVCEDLVRVMGDPLLKACKKNLRREYGFEEGKRFRSSSGKKAKPARKWNIDAIVSTELQKRVPQDSSSLRRCDGALGTACFVTGSFGFAAAGRIVDMIASDTLVTPRGHKWIQEEE